MSRFLGNRYKRIPIWGIAPTEKRCYGRLGNGSSARPAPPAGRFFWGIRAGPHIGHIRPSNFRANLRDSSQVSKKCASCRLYAPTPRENVTHHINWGKTEKDRPQLWFCTLRIVGLRLYRKLSRENGIISSRSRSSRAPILLPWHHPIRQRRRACMVSVSQMEA